MLQGLWGYGALVAQDQLHDPETAARLVSSLEHLPVDTPDGWYWLGRTLEARGDTSGAQAAREIARRLAPRIGVWRYRQRLLASH